MDTEVLKQIQQETVVMLQLEVSDSTRRILGKNKIRIRILEVRRGGEESIEESADVRLRFTMQSEESFKNLREIAAVPGVVSVDTFSICCGLYVFPRVFADEGYA